MTRLFVYGTLKRGCKNHRHLSGQRYLADVRTTPGYRLYSLGDYPGLVPATGDTAGITGELWEVDDAALARLDAFEGVDEGLYRREPVHLATPSIATADQPVFTYIYARDLTGRSPLGDTWTEPDSGVH